MDASVKAEAARQTGFAAMASGVTGATMLPIIRSITLGIILIVTPMILIFMPTAWFGQIVIGVIGLYVWVSLWGVIDVLLHRFAMDYAYRTFAEVRALGLGSAAIQTFSTSSLKTLSNFATMRWMAGGIAAAIGGMIGFKGSAALASMAGGMTNMQQSAAQRAGAMASPEGRAQILTSQEMSGATLANHGEYGAARYMDQMTADQRRRMEAYTLGEKHFGSGRALGDAGARVDATNLAGGAAGAKVLGMDGAVMTAERNASKNLAHANATTNDDMSKIGTLSGTADSTTAGLITPEMQAEMTSARLGSEYGAAIKQGNFAQAAELASKRMAADVERFGHLSEGQLQQLGRLQASADAAKAKYGDTSAEYHAAAVKLQQGYASTGVYKNPEDARHAAAVSEGQRVGAASVYPTVGEAGAVAAMGEQQRFAKTTATDKYWAGDYASMAQSEITSLVSQNAAYHIGENSGRLGAGMRTSVAAERAGMVASGKAISEWIQQSGMTMDSSKGALRFHAGQNTGFIAQFFGTDIGADGSVTIDINSAYKKGMDLNTAFAAKTWEQVNYQAQHDKIHSNKTPEQREEWANREYARVMNSFISTQQHNAADTSRFEYGASAAPVAAAEGLLQVPGAARDAASDVWMAGKLGQDYERNKAWREKLRNEKHGE